MMAFPITAHQRDLLCFIAGHIEAKGRAPSYDAMRRALGVRAKSTAYRMVACLEERGWIRRGAGGEITLTRAVALPRAPDGAPLFPVRLKESR